VLKLTGVIKEVADYDGEYGTVLQVRVFTDVTKTSPHDWADLLEVPATAENRKNFVVGATIESLPVRVWAKTSRAGRAWLKFTVASS